MSEKGGSPRADRIVSVTLCIYFTSLWNCSGGMITIHAKYISLFGVLVMVVDNTLLYKHLISKSQVTVKVILIIQ